MTKESKSRIKLNAESLVLKDPNGENKIVLDASVLGYPNIMIRGRGKSSLILCVDRGNPRVELYLQNGKLAAAVGMGESGGGFVMYDEDGKICCHLNYERLNKRVSILGAAGSHAFSLSTTKVNYAKPKKPS
jgi:hypothetical protein